MDAEKTLRLYGLMGIMNQNLPSSLKERLMGEMLEILDVELTAEELKELEAQYKPMQYTAVPFKPSFYVQCPLCHEPLGSPSEEAIPWENKRYLVKEHAKKCLGLVLLRHLIPSLREAMKK